ncbi:hypothetical protein QO004_004712 [Rhizobium mesoamericanum]|uniref:hypothetical protein n=1 Tax=Rhizobium mesoamericanum TaxID=1079800 RepID=UPI00278304F4|nr:hypothetical protein [Rhizobium mesoamericanum]MDQ0562907.1 hypothetical protein [Rhizobium mesoamericanum]
MDSFRHAHRADLTDIIEMLFDDDLGATREIVSNLLNTRYIAVRSNRIRNWGLSRAAKA